MPGQTRHATTILFLVLAVLFYALGLLLPAVVLLVFGGIAELVFWYRLFTGGRSSPSS